MHVVEEVGGISHLCQDRRRGMTGIHIRQYERIRLAAKATITSGENEIADLRAKDISLSGLYIYGKHPIPTEPCTITVKGTWLESEPIFLSFTARISRQDHCGTGFQFTKMDHEVFEMLQTFLLYGSQDPMDLGVEFASSCPFEVADKNFRSYGSVSTDLTC